MDARTNCHHIIEAWAIWLITFTKIKPNTFFKLKTFQEGSISLLTSFILESLIFETSQIILQTQLFHNLPRAIPHSYPSSNLSKLCSRFIQIDLGVRYLAKSYAESEAPDTRSTVVNNWYSADSLRWICTYMTAILISLMSYVAGWMTCYVNQSPKLMNIQWWPPAIVVHVERTISRIKGFYSQL